VRQQLEALALAFVLSLATTIAHAAPLFSEKQQGPQGNREGVRTDEMAVTEGVEVTIAVMITVPEVKERIRDVSQYIAGQHHIIPAVEDALMGMKPGEGTHLDLQPEQAFGRYDEQKMTRIRRDMLPPTAQPGSMYQTRQGELVTVIALEDDTAVVDRNHPLAGKHLVVDVVVLTVERPQSLGGEDFAPSTEI
jgi:FKBP-type peptidyl-prolyl cis-trans isomerase 2